MKLGSMTANQKFLPDEAKSKSDCFELFQLIPLASPNVQARTRLQTVKGIYF